MIEQFEILRGVLAKQREHAVVRHDRRALRQQVIFQRSPVQTQRLKEKPVWIILGKTHIAHGGGNVQPQVFNEAGGSHETVQQGCRTQFAFKPVIKPRTGTGIPRQRSNHALSGLVIFQPYQWFIAESSKQSTLYSPLSPHRQTRTGPGNLRVFPSIKAQHHPRIQLRDIAVTMKRRAIDLQHFAARFDALNGPGTRRKPQVFEGVAQFFVTLGRQLCDSHAFLHVGVIALQLFKLQGMAA